MKHKASLTLVEQCIMLLVFAWAAAMCMRAFLWAAQTSDGIAETDRSVQVCQSAVETLKHCGKQGGDMGRTMELAAAQMGGSVEQGLWQICYDENWEPMRQVDSDAPYHMYAQGQPGEDGVLRARVWTTASDREDAVIFELTAAWQEVGSR